MKAVHRLTSISVVIALMMFGCKSKRVENPVLARVGGEVLLRSDLVAERGLQGIESGSSTTTTTLQKAAEQWAMNEILIQEATKRRLDQDSLFQIELARIRDNMTIQALYAELEKSIKISDDEIAEEYDLNRQNYTTPLDQVDLVYILCPSRESARKARIELQNGTELSAILSEDYQLQGEEIGWVAEQDLNAQIADVAFALVPGGISSPIQFDQKQYIVIQCRQRRQSGTVLPLEEVEKTIRQHLFTEKKLKTEKALRDSLWVAYSPEIYLNTNDSDSDSSQ